VKKRTTRKDKLTKTRGKGTGREEEIPHPLEHDILEAQQRWVCPFAAAAYIVGLERQVQFIRNACADLYHLVSPDSARLMKLRDGRNEDELCHADGHRHRRGYVRFHKPEC
jgi:hypothetical protein